MSLQEIEGKKLRVVYKKVKVAMPHCPDCGEQLSGNNSMMSPYRCRCGVWKSSWEEHFIFNVVPEARA